MNTEDEQIGTLTPAVKRVAIIGAGISGVSLAFKLSQLKSAGAAIAITVFDDKDEAGGCIKSIVQDGYLAESGPTGVLNTRASFRRLYEEAGLGEILQPSTKATKTRYIQMNHAIHKAPQGPIEAIKTPLLSFNGKMRVLGEIFAKGKTDSNDESILSFASRRLGEEAANNLIATMIGGIYAGDAAKLSAQATFPALVQMEREHGGLIRSLYAKARARKKTQEIAKRVTKKGREAREQLAMERAREAAENPGGDRTQLISTKGGMQGLVSKLAEKCDGVNFLYNSTVTNITKTDGEFTITANGEAKKFDIVAICCNANAAKDIVAELNAEMAELFASVKFAPIYTCGMGFSAADIGHPLDGFGYLVMPSDKSPILGTIFSSALFQGRADSGKALLTCITIGDKGCNYLIEKPKEELYKLAFDNIKDVLHIRNQPEVVIDFKHEHAIPQYYVGHTALVKRLLELEHEIGGFFIGGNTLRGVSVADCAMRSFVISKQIEEQL